MKLVKDSYAPKYIKKFEEVCKEAREKFPVVSNDLEELVESIHTRYPELDKVNTAIIVKETFSVIREVLMMGHEVSFNLMFKTRLLFMKLSKFCATRLKNSTIAREPLDLSKYYILKMSTIKGDRWPK